MTLDLTTAPAKFLVPITAMFLVALLKLFIGRKVTFFYVATAVFEFPVYVISCALSIVAGFVLLGRIGNENFFLAYLGLLVALAIAIFLYHCAVDIFDDKKFLGSYFLCSINLIGSFIILAVTVFSSH